MCVSNQAAECSVYGTLYRHSCAKSWLMARSKQLQSKHLCIYLFSLTAHQ